MASQKEPPPSRWVGLALIIIGWIIAIPVTIVAWQVHWIGAVLVVGAAVWMTLDYLKRGPVPADHTWMGRWTSRGDVEWKPESDVDV